MSKESHIRDNGYHDERTEQHKQGDALWSGEHRFARVQWGGRECTDDPGTRWGGASPATLPRRTRLMRRVTGVAITEMAPHQPSSSVLAVIRRKVANPQSRQNGPSIDKN